MVIGVHCVAEIPTDTQLPPVYPWADGLCVQCCLITPHWAGSINTTDGIKVGLGCFNTSECSSDPLLQVCSKKEPGSARGDMLTAFFTLTTQAGIDNFWRCQVLVSTVGIRVSKFSTELVHIWTLLRRPEVLVFVYFWCVIVKSVIQSPKCT